MTDAKLPRRQSKLGLRIVLSLLLVIGMLVSGHTSRATDANDPLAEATRKIATEITQNGKAYSGR